jgi:hypothetical protein
MVLFAAAAAAQSTGQQDPYQGTSNPPPDDSIVINNNDAGVSPSKPSAAKPYAARPASEPAAAIAAQPESIEAAQPVPSKPSAGAVADDNADDGIVRVAPESVVAQPALNNRAIEDPDGDIVHPAPMHPGELAAGTTIRVRLLDRLSTADSRNGDRFHTRVAFDVVQNDQVLIPAGAEIDGVVVGVSSGEAGGRGSMRLRPDTVILSDGMRFQLYAQTTAAPGSNVRIGKESTINAGSRAKKDGIEYTGAVGAGVITGAALAGPGGALAGGIIGAGLITVHLLVSHPQADLKPGTALIFSLIEPLNLVSSNATVN